ncbi:MAG: putative addiction module antidote protein [Bdellovibrio sp.]|nr:putative addiction module antidote protein [Bdellovibrio sp.]
MSKGTSFNDYLMEKLKDPELACHFISEAIEQNDSDYLKVALGDIVKAYGVGYIAEQTGINRQTIYKMLSENGNPTHKNLVAILDALGLELTVRPKKTIAS